MLHENTLPLEAIALGLGMVFVTTAIQGLFMVSGTHFAELLKARYGRFRSHLSKSILISGLTAWMFLAVVIEVLVWTSLYLYHPSIPELPDLGTAFYFSMVTFTSVGYGDVVLTGNWRVLASLQAANGVIIFGWTTALIFYYIQRVYARE